MRRKVIIITGMHRSGTSALAGLLSNAGLEVGKSVMPPAPDNPVGFFENRRIVKMNDRMLKVFDATWDLPFSVSFDRSQIPGIQNFYSEFDKILAEEFKSDQIVIKDPRISKLLPFYIDYFQQAQFDFSFIICLRNPIEIFHSLNNRQGISQEHAALMIFSYLRDAEYYTRGFKRNFVTYRNLLQHSEDVLNKIRKDFTLDLASNDVSAINPRLRHFVAKKLNAKDASPLWELIGSQHKQLVRLSDDDTRQQMNTLDKGAKLLQGLIQSILSSGALPYHKLAQLSKKSLVYVDYGTGFADWNANYSPISETLSYYKSETKLNSRRETKSVRWFPLHDEHTKIRITRVYLVNFDGSERVISFPNQPDLRQEDGYYIFEEGNDYVDIKVEGVYDKFVIEGDYEVIGNAKWIDHYLLKEEKVEQERFNSVVEVRNKLHEEKQKLVQQRSQLSEEIDRLKELENTKNEQLRTIMSERDDLKEQLQNMAASKDQMIADISAGLEADYKERSLALSQYRDEMIDNEAEFEEVKSQLTQETESLRADLESVIEEQTQLQGIADQAVAERDSLQENSNALEAELAVLHNELANLKAGTEEILTSMSSEKSAAKKAKKKFKKLKADFENLMQNRNAIQLQLEAKKAALNEERQVLAYTKELVSEFESGTINLSERWNEEKHELRRNIAELYLSNSELRNANQQLGEELVTVKEALITAEDELQALQALQESLEPIGEQVTNDEVEKWDQAFELIKSKDQELDHLHELCQQLHDTVHDKTQLYADLLESYGKLKSAYDEMYKSNVNQIANSDTKITNLQSEISALQQNIHQNENEINKLQLGNKNLEISLRAKKGLIEDLKSDLLLKQNELLHVSKDKQRLENQMKAAFYHLNGVKKSLSYRLGYGLTKPLRFLYDKVSNQPFNKSTFGKALVDKNEAPKIQRSASSAPLSYTTNTDQMLSVSGPSNQLQYNAEQVSFESAPPHPDMIVDHGKLANVLYISPNLPDFDESSGGKRATHMLDLLQEKHNVFAFTLGDKPQKYIDKLRSLNVNVLETSRFEKAYDLMPKIDVIIYAWYYTYFDAAYFRDVYPEARIIVDSVDVHWLREFRSIGLLEGLTHEVAEMNKKRELQVYANSSIIWTVTKEDKLEVMKELPNADVRVVSNIHEMVEPNFIEKDSKSMLFFGGYRHYPNISAAEILAKEILPRVRKEIPEANLILAGSHAPESIQALGQLDGVTYEGFIEDEDVNDLYRRSFLIATPLQAGAGIKGKICEAIVHRVPVVTNGIGNEGINLITEEDALVTDDLVKMSQYVVDAMNGAYDLNSMTSRAADKLLKIVGPNVAKEAMDNSIYPEVSICVVTWNRLELLEKCCESVLEKTTYPNYKLIVHSNGCADGTREYLTELAKRDSRVVPVLSDSNDVFVLPNNQMMERYPENDVVLLNNDTIVTDNWLSALHEVAYSHPSIGISGSKLLYPDGTLQEFGSELYADGTGRNIGKWEDPTKPEYNKITEVGYVSGCSLYLKRSTLNKVGYFDEQFHPCYCEDSDLCYTAKEHGLKTVVTHKSVIYHFEGGTSGTDTSSGMKRYQEINMKKFLEKHRNKDNGINW